MSYELSGLCGRKREILPRMGDLNIHVADIVHPPSTEHVLDQRRHKKRLFMQPLFHS